MILIQKVPSKLSIDKTNNNKLKITKERMNHKKIRLKGLTHSKSQQELDCTFMLQALTHEILISICINENNGIKCTLLPRI